MIEKIKVGHSVTRRSCFISCAVFILWATLALANAETLRVATYNVKDGLEAPGTPSFENVARDLHRLGADVVGFQELKADQPNLSSLGSRLELPHSVYNNNSGMAVGLLSRYPVAESHWIDEDGMWRPILLARLDVSPATSRKVWVAVLHLKCCNNFGTESATRATELDALRQAILDRCDPVNDLVIVKGDFNLVAPGEDANNFFEPEQIFKLDARHAGPGRELWTWRGNSQYPPGALDHIMVNAPARLVGVESEVYDVKKDAQGIDGLEKFGTRPPLTADYESDDESDHLPVFADLELEDLPPFWMDGLLDSEGYTLSGSGITLRVAVRGSQLYVATQSTGNQTNGNDHHILITDALMETASSPAPWAKAGFTALPVGKPYLAAEGINDYAGWFDAGNGAIRRKTAGGAGVLEGVVDLRQVFGGIPEYLHIAAIAYETSDSSSGNPSLGRVVGQVPTAVVIDNNITPDEFLRIPLRNIRDSAGDGRFDIHVPGRGFQPVLEAGAQALNLRWPTSPERTYRVWHRPRLDTGVWQVLEEITTGTRDWEAALENPGSTTSSASGFYRIELLPP